MIVPVLILIMIVVVKNVIQRKKEMIRKSVLLTSLAGCRQLCYMALKEKRPRKLRHTLKDLERELDFIRYCATHTQESQS